MPEVPAQEFTLKLSYSAKSSEGVRLKAGPGPSPRLARMLAGYVQGETELVEPLPVEFGRRRRISSACPTRRSGSQYHHKRPPVTRHALVVLESVDAIDLAFETFVCGLLDGETDTAGYPEYNAIVGGVASHWDEITGDMIVRAVVGWGGKGVRGDTDRNAARILAGLFSNIAGDHHALGSRLVERPVACAGRGRPGVRPLRFRLRARAGLLLPEVRHADAARLAAAGETCRPTTTSARTAATRWRSFTPSTATARCLPLVRRADEEGVRRARRSTSRAAAGRARNGPGEAFESRTKDPGSSAASDAGPSSGGSSGGSTGEASGGTPGADSAAKDAD